MYQKLKNQFLQSLSDSLDPQTLLIVMSPFPYGDDSKLQSDLKWSHKKGLSWSYANMDLVISMCPHSTPGEETL